MLINKGFEEYANVIRYVIFLDKKSAKYTHILSKTITTCDYFVERFIEEY